MTLEAAVRSAEDIVSARLDLPVKEE
jgi:hypothetical protein